MDAMLEMLSSNKSPKNHWDSVYCNEAPHEVTWYQTVPEGSLRMLEQAGAKPDSSIIDVGGGTSTLSAHLLDRRFRNLTVLDISSRALETAIRLLGPEAGYVRWIEADIMQYEFKEQFDIWHDRAVFHFLTDAGQRRDYVQALEKAVRQGGHVIISTFGVDGPDQCSGLPVMRYSPAALSAEFGAGYGLFECRKEIHMTPTGHLQHFIYCLFRKKD